MIEVKFDTTNNAGGDGSLVVRHLLGVDAPVGDITGTITDPAQGIIGVNTPSTVPLNLALPLDINGRIIYGVYTISLSLNGEDYTGEYKLCDRRSSDYPISANVYCLLGIAEIKDNGPYVNGAIVNRSFRIRRPAVQTFTEEARDDTYATQQQSTKRVEVGYGGVDYTMGVSGTVEVSINATSTLQVQEVFLTSSVTKMADCRKSLCKVSDCINDYARRLDAKAISCGTGLTSKDSLVMMRVMLLFSRLMAAIDCLDVIAANKIYEDIERIIGECQCNTGDNTPIRIGFDVAIGLARRNPLRNISISGTSQKVRLLENEDYEFFNVEEIDKVAANVISRAGESIDMSLTPPPWTLIQILAEYRSGGTVDLNPPKCYYRSLPSLGGFVQIYGTLRTSDELYNTPVVITDEPLPESIRVIGENSIPFPLFDKNRYVVGSVYVRSDGHLVVRTNVAPPVDGGVGVPGLFDGTYYFSAQYDPTLRLISEPNNILG